MSRFLRLALLSAAFTSFSAGAARADTLPLRRVVITTSGLALYQHEGPVSGNATIDLPTRLDRVDDMLKSLVVLDAKGQLGGVTLPGRQPLEQIFRDLPFGQDDLSSLMQLLNTLRGASVEAVAGGQTVQGRLMNVTEETEQTKDGDTITRHRVSILAADGIHTVVLEDAAHIQFTDKAVQAQLDRALGALFANRAKDQRTLSVNLRGDGTRDVGIAYIEEAPLWKSSYRLVLPQDDKNGKAALQGWAVLENTTGQDWKDVSVTLMSGAPVTYHQALYESYYLPRPDLPVRVMNRVLPRTDQGTVAPADDAANGAMQEGDAGAAGGNTAEAVRPMRARGMMMKTMAAPAAAPMAMAAMDAAAPMPAAPPVPETLAAMTQTDAADTASQMLFAFPQPVDLAAGSSLMVPFVSRSLPAEKLWVYQPPEAPAFQPMNGIVMPRPQAQGDADHPFAAIAVRNDGASGLPPGILTLYSQSAGGLLYVGDADMPLVPKGEDRYISFALDTKTKIDRQTQEDRHLGVITIAKGMLNQKTVASNTTTYTIRAPADEDRTLVIEHPRREGWTLVRPEGLSAEPETTPTAYRLRVKVAAGKDAVVKVTLTRADTEAIALAQADPGDLDTRMAAAGKDLPDAVRKALAHVKELQAAAAAQQQELNDDETQRQAISDDQQRLRENLKTVSPDTTLGKRYLATLNGQEDKLDALTKREDDARARLAAAQKALADYVAGLAL